MTDLTELTEALEDYTYGDPLIWDDEVVRVPAAEWIAEHVAPLLKEARREGQAEGWQIRNDEGWEPTNPYRSAVSGEPKCSCPRSCGEPEEDCDVHGRNAVSGEPKQELNDYGWPPYRPAADEEQDPSVSGEPT